MSITKKQVFTPEFRFRMAQLIIDGKHSVAEVSIQFGVGKSTLDTWVRNLKLENEGKLTGGTPMSQDKLLISKLEKRIKQLEEENTLLKKGIALLK